MPAWVGVGWIYEQSQALVRIMDEQSWASIRRMVSAWVKYMTAWVGLGLGAQVGELDWRNGWVGAGQASQVCGGMGQGSGPVRVGYGWAGSGERMIECRGGLTAVRVVRGLKVERERVQSSEKKRNRKKKLIKGRINFFFFFSFQLQYTVIYGCALQQDR